MEQAPHGPTADTRGDTPPAAGGTQPGAPRAAPTGDQPTGAQPTPDGSQKTDSTGGDSPKLLAGKYPDVAALEQGYLEQRELQARQGRETGALRQEVAALRAQLQNGRGGEAQTPEAPAIEGDIGELLLNDPAAYTQRVVSMAAETAARAVAPMVEQGVQQGLAQDHAAERSRNEFFAKYPDLGEAQELVTAKAAAMETEFDVETMPRDQAEEILVARCRQTLDKIRGGATADAPPVGEATPPREHPGAPQAVEAEEVRQAREAREAADEQNQRLARATQGFGGWPFAEGHEPE